MPSLSRFCERMRYWCDDADLGYDQIQRWNVWVGGETDCSALLITALREAGFDTGSATYTGDLSWNLTARGWERLYPNLHTARPGDILLSDEHHVAAVVSGWGWYSTVAEAWLDENGGIYYGQSGDQTGLETRTRGIYDFPWDCILRYAGETEEDVSAQDVWNYNWESTAPEGNMYNCVLGIYKNAQPHSMWEYHYDSDGKNTAPGGNMYNCMIGMYRKVEALEKNVANLKAGGATVDYTKLAKAVADEFYARMKQ